MRLLLPLLLIVSAGLSQQLQTHLVVSTRWLALHLNDPAVVVVHVGRDRAGYTAGHIPGARFLGWDQFTLTRDGLPVELPPIPKLVECFENLGIGNSTRVIFYSEDAGLGAARAWFTLDFLGHGNHASLLDGGLKKWRLEGRPLSTETPRANRQRLTPRPRPEVVARLEQVRVLASSPQPRVVLLDTRPPAEYLGEKPFGNPPRAGHIPGAANLYWLDALAGLDYPVLKPEAELRRLFLQAGVTPGSKVITYCGAGVQAAYVYFLARYLGYKAALYDGSMSEWSRAPDAPLVRGPRRY